VTAQSPRGDDRHLGGLPDPRDQSRRRRLPDEGSVEVIAYDEQSDEKVDLDRWRTLAERVLDAEGIRGEAELSLLFVDEATITDLNVRFMGGSGSTDVLSFPIDESGESGRWPDGSTPGPQREPLDVPLLLGDVVVCPAVARRNAPEHAGEVDDEVALLVVHGVLHVLGHDHASAAEEAAMQDRERAHLERFHGALPATTWPAPGAAS
jgi:probable rRNA maturation factor